MADIQSIDFIGSFKYLDQCPTDQVPEYAFIGRSNVGKSSLINSLLGRKEVAHESSTPGKTQSMNFFLIDSRWRIVDLPGYGFARISKKERAKWSVMIESYLMKRKQLACAFLLMDMSIAPQKIDLKRAEWMAEHRIPFTILFSKVDKIKKSEVKRQYDVFAEYFEKEWTEMPNHIMTSASKRLGQKEVLDSIEEINEAFYKLV